MTSTLPPDPYLALGVPKDADQATIKSTYRKLVLKCHPDKVTDESLKEQKREEFDKIQQAYEIIGDEEKRAKYDAEVRLDILRKEKLARGSPSKVDVKTARYETRTAAPAGATFSSKGPSRYEERKSPRFEEDRHFEERSSRKYDTYEAYPKHSSSTRTSRPEKEPVKVRKSSSDRSRTERVKSRDKEERRDRSGKFVYIEDESSSNDEKARYEAEYRRRSDEERRRRDEDDALRKAAADARKKAEVDRRSYEEPIKESRRHRSSEDIEFDRQRKLSEDVNNAVRYIHRSKVEDDRRPSPGRTTSSRDVRPEYERSPSSARRPEAVRRSSARPKDLKDRERDSRDRKGMPMIVDWEDDRPSFKHSNSSPSAIHIPPPRPVRSQTEYEIPPRRSDTSPPTPVIRRSDTMPSVPSSSSRRKETTLPRSGLRTSESAGLQEPESPFPTVPAPRTPTTTKYYYPTASNGMPLVAEDVGVANGHRTVLHEPTRHRPRSPSPLASMSRPPMGPNRPSEPITARVTSTGLPPPPLGRSTTYNVGSTRAEDRGRSSSKLYGEVTSPSDYSKRENTRRPNISPERIAYAKKIGPEDISWSGPKEREFRKPVLSRNATTVY